jgi:hypothetical protein
MRGKNYVVSAYPMPFQDILDYLERKKYEESDNRLEEATDIQESEESWPSLNNVETEEVEKPNTWGDQLLKKLRKSENNDEPIKLFDNPSIKLDESDKIMPLTQVEANKRLNQMIVLKNLQLDVLDSGIENGRLRQYNKDLEEELDMLNERYTILKRKFDNEYYMNKNKQKYEEMLNNLEYLTNRVSDQFLKTTYSDYVIYH